MAAFVGAEVQKTLDQMYHERNVMILAMAKMAAKLGWNMGFWTDPSLPEWPVMGIDLPTGQVSWHINPRDMVGGWDAYEGEWDGHSTQEKLDRLKEFIKGQGI